MLGKLSLGKVHRGLSNREVAALIDKMVNALHHENIPRDVLAEACLTLEKASKWMPDTSALLKACPKSWDEMKWSTFRMKAIVDAGPIAVSIEPPIQTIPLDEIRAMSPTMRNMGLGKGWITQDQIDQLDEINIQA
jgi:hypothetical protein